MKYDKDKKNPNAPTEEQPPKNEDGTDAAGFFTHPRGHVRDRIILHETRESYKEGQFVGLNGFPFLIQYGKEIDVPRPVIEMLRTRIVTIVEKNMETGVETVRNLPRFNFTVVGLNVNKIPDDVVGAFQCEICEKPFQTKMALMSHMRTHKGVGHAHGEGDRPNVAGQAGG